MKHSTTITLALLVLFVLSQVLGLALVAPAVKITQNVVNVTTNETVQVVVSEQMLAGGGERPETQYPVLYIAVAVLIGTLLVLLLVKYRLFTVWKVWFLLAVVYTMWQSFAVYQVVSAVIAFLLALGLGLWKVYRPNFIVHNLTELFVYAGLAIVFVPILSVMHMIILLLLISLYDMYAVWKSKHMVKMAQFQTESNLFAGMSIPYELPVKKGTPGAVKKKVRMAILGGGDIGFPLLFSGVVLQSMAQEFASLIDPSMTPFAKASLLAPLFGPVLLITLCTTIALGLLFYYAEKDKFYPAMPFVSAGCLMGYGLLLLL